MCANTLTGISSPVLSLIQICLIRFFVFFFWFWRGLDCDWMGQFGWRKRIKREKGKKKLQINCDDIAAHSLEKSRHSEHPNPNHSQPPPFTCTGYNNHNNHSRATREL